MPKRPKESEDEWYNRKLKKLKKKREKRRRRMSPDLSTPSNSPVPIDEEVEDVIEIGSLGVQEETKTDLDQVILEALGEVSQKDKGYGDEVHPEILKRVEDILVDGLKEKEKVLEKYKIPKNAHLLDAPKLNIELEGLLNDSVKQRDNKIQQRQQQLGTALGATLALLDDLVNNKNNFDSLKGVSILSDVSRMLSDLHHEDTTTRRKLILPNLDKKVYLGSFAVGAEEHAARVDQVAARLHLMTESAEAVPVLVVVSLAGIKVCNPEDQSIVTSHALRRISYATCESSRSLFAFVSRAPRASHGPLAPRASHAAVPLAHSAPHGAVPLAPRAPDSPAPPAHHCHAFKTDTPQQAEALNTLVGDAFRMAFASQLQPTAPLWSKEVSGVDCKRPPNSLPGLQHHYPCRDRSPAQCEMVASEASPSSSEESCSPTERHCYRRLGERFGERLGERFGERFGELCERPPLMRRLALGLSGALLQPSDDDSTPLVPDTPNTPTNAPLCLNGGYINEAADAERRRRDDERKCPSKDGSSSNSGASSSGTSSCGAGGLGGRGAGGAAVAGGGGPGGAGVPPHEPDLQHAPWFQHGLPREIAVEVLRGEAVGAFLVRGSSSARGCLALSVRVPRRVARAGVAHYLILRTGAGYKIKGFTKEFRSLSALVTHHSVMPELLPAPLLVPRLSRAAPPARRDHADLDALLPPPAAPARPAPRPLDV